MKRFYKYDSEANKAEYLIHDHQNVYKGEAYCHPEDKEFANQQTGLMIAQTRAQIACFKAKRKESKMKFKTLSDFHKSLLGTKKYDVDSYCERHFNKELEALKEEIEIYDDMVKSLTLYLSEYLNQREEYYQKYRKNKGED